MGAGHVVLHHQRGPHIECEARKGAGEILGSDTDDREVMLVQGHRSSENVWIGTEAPLPQSIADHNDCMRVWCPILFGKKRAPDQRFYAEDVKVIARNDGSPHTLRLLAAPQIKRQHLVGDQTGEDLILVAVVQVVDVGRRQGGVVACCAPYLDQFFRLLNARQRCQKDCLDPGEDGRVRANAQSQREHHRKSEPWSAPKQPYAVSHVLPKVFHHGYYPAIFVVAPCKFRIQSQAICVTLPKQHLPEGFFTSQAQLPALTSAVIRSPIAERPVSAISS